MYFMTIKIKKMICFSGSSSSYPKKDKQKVEIINLI